MLRLENENFEKRNALVLLQRSEIKRTKEQIIMFTIKINLNQNKMLAKIMKSNLF